MSVPVGFIRSMFTGNPLAQVDELIVFAAMGELFLSAMTYVDWQWGSHVFSGMGYATAFAAIMGTCGLGAGARNWMNGKSDDHDGDHHDVQPPQP